MTRVRRTLLSERLARVTIRRALLAGFVSIFTLWLVWAYQLNGRLAEMQRRAEQVHTRFAQSEEVLLTIAGKLLLGSVYLRDAFLDTRPDAVRISRSEVEKARSEIDRALTQHVRHVESEVERDHWTRLQAELAQYWSATLPVLTPSLGVNRDRARAIMSEQVIPRRRTIIQISEQLRALNRDAYRRREAALALLDEELRRRIWMMSAVALVLGVAVAIGATRYAGALESHIRAQHRRDVERQRELEGLSSQLLRAQEDERRMIARELHDEIGQALTAIKIELSVAERSIAAAEHVSEPLAEARAITDRALQAVRDVSQLLHPPMLDDLGLAHTLAWYLRGFARRTGIRADLTQDRMDVRVNSYLETCAYRIIQEALTNVARHAQATSCRVYLQRLPHSLLITVEDDGKGVGPQRPRSLAEPGLGLVGIRERVASLDGTFRLESTAGKGTRLTAELPLSGDSQAPDAGAARSTGMTAAVTAENG